MFEDCGGKIVQKIWPPLGTKDFGPYIPAIKGDADAVFTPGSHDLAIIRVHGSQSDVFGAARFRGTGVFRQLAYSPNGRWLLVTWPTANQWVFLRTHGHRRIVGASRISAQFGSFPRVQGWCCGR